MYLPFPTKEFASFRFKKLLNWPMESLETKLEQLGLAQYTEALIENGFENWATVLDITEDDLDELGFKLGHRRILQRDIAIQREPPPSPGETRTPSASQSGNEALSPTIAAEDSSNAPGKRPKRRYRWHPRADPNAPKRPKTAYVKFADHLRTGTEVAGMTFVDIAREVGRQWQIMDADTKQEWENQAAAVSLTFSQRTGFSLHMEGYAGI
jgi:SAM domain (Sterile alpha motif)